MDNKTILTVISTVAVAACAVILVLKGDVSHALTFGALLSPSVVQLMPAAGKVTP